MPERPGLRHTPATHRHWLDQIEAHGRNLTVWEEEFIENISPQIKIGRTLTPGQAETLERIYAERTP